MKFSCINMIRSATLAIAIDLQYNNINMKKIVLCSVVLLWRGFRRL
jgi:hypothetical protein